MQFEKAIQTLCDAGVEFVVIGRVHVGKAGMHEEAGPS
jgi:hypothetical protein